MFSPIHITRLWNAGLVAVLALACAAALYTSWGLPETYAGLAPAWYGAAPGSPPDAAQDLTARDLAVEDFLPQQRRDITPDQARAINIASPLDRVNPLPAPFQPEWLSAADMESATDCLTSAIYYEAASEPFAGQLAVAQVILNRLRHPRFPKTVCGVVNQGSDRATGCQFTFTCDGSLARRPNPASLQRAHSVAQAALHGAVSAQAGQATHYHTIWIVPVWAADMRKVAIVSHHVFYRPPAFYPGYGLMPVSGIMPDIAMADGPPHPAIAAAGEGAAVKEQRTLLMPAVATRAPAMGDASWVPPLAKDAPSPGAAASGEGKPAPPSPQSASPQPRFRFGGERRRPGAIPLAGN